MCVCVRCDSTLVDRLSPTDSSCDTLATALSHLACVMTGKSVLDRCVLIALWCFSWKLQAALDLSFEFMLSCTVLLGLARRWRLLVPCHITAWISAALCVTVTEVRLLDYIRVNNCGICIVADLCNWYMSCIVMWLVACAAYTSRDSSDVVDAGIMLPLCTLLSPRFSNSVRMSKFVCIATFAWSLFFNYCCI